MSPGAGRRDPATTDADLCLEFSAAAHSYATESVLDLDPFNVVMGIEVLGAVAEVGLILVPSLVDARRVKVLSVSIDLEADALYLRLENGTSYRQVVRPAILSVAADGTLAGLRICSGRAERESGEDNS